MGDCVHPRSQGYTDDQGRSRCGACGDVWDNDKQTFVPVLSDPPPLDEGPLASLLPPHVIVVDVRNGNVRADGSNLDLPSGADLVEALSVITAADVLIEVQPDMVIVRRGNVTVYTTKSALQLNAEKADRELAHRTANPVDDLAVGEHPITQKFARVWDGSVPSGKPVEGGLKGH